MFENISYEQKKRILSILSQIEFDKKSIYDVLFDKKYFYDYIKSETDVADFIVLEEYVKKFINMYPERFEKYLDKHPENRKKYSELNKKYESNNWHPISPKDITIRKTFNLEWQEITPYTILGIEEKEYAKEELLEIVGKKINFIKNHGIDKEQMKNDIDKILDAYDELIKTSSKKR